MDLERQIHALERQVESNHLKMHSEDVEMVSTSKRQEPPWVAPYPPKRARGPVKNLAENPNYPNKKDMTPKEVKAWAGKHGFHMVKGPQFVIQDSE